MKVITRNGKIFIEHDENNPRPWDQVSMDISQIIGKDCFDPVTIYMGDLCFQFDPEDETHHKKSFIKLIKRAAKLYFGYEEASK